MNIPSTLQTAVDNFKSAQETAGYKCQSVSTATDDSFVITIMVRNKTNIDKEFEKEN